jgi:hypothetical protein
MLFCAVIGADRLKYICPVKLTLSRGFLCQTANPICLVILAGNLITENPVQQ